MLKKRKNESELRVKVELLEGQIKALEAKLFGVQYPDGLIYERVNLFGDGGYVYGYSNEDKIMYLELGSWFVLNGLEYEIIKKDNIVDIRFKDTSGEVMKEYLVDLNKESVMDISNLK